MVSDPICPAVYNGDDPTGAVAGAAVGSLLGRPLGSKIEKKFGYEGIATDIHGYKAVSKVFYNTMPVANVFSSSFASGISSDIVSTAIEKTHK